MMFVVYRLFIIRTKRSIASGEAMEILYGAKTVFTRSAITPPKVNRFGWNLDHCEHIAGGWLWQILGAIRSV